MKALVIFLLLVVNAYSQEKISLDDLQTKDSIIYYKKKKFSGTAYTYFENGQIESTRVYKKGVLNGDYNYYHENGQLKLNITFENNIRVGKSLSYYANGKLYIVENYQNGLPEGESIIYDENGGIKTKANYKKGVIDGLYTEYYDGYPYSGMMVNGKREGEWTCYDKDSNLLIHNFYSNDIKLPHKYDYYYENGQLESTKYYLDNKQEGKWIYYHTNGTIKLIQNWVNGLRDGESILYDESGNILGKKIYSKGEMISCDGKCD